MSIRSSITARWKTWLVGAVVAVVLLCTVGVWVFLNVIEKKAPAALQLSHVTTTTSVSSASGSGATGATSGDDVSGSWQIGTGTEVGYRVKETLFGQSKAAVGRTTAVTGSMSIAGTTVQAATFTVDMTKVASDQSQRDDQFQGRIMDTSSYPTATFVLSQPLGFSAVPAVGKHISVKATGKLTMHGATKSVTFTLNAQRTTTGIEVQGQIPITFSDYNIDNPSGGPASVGNNGTLEFLLELTKA